MTQQLTLWYTQYQHCKPTTYPHSEMQDGYVWAPSWQPLMEAQLPFVSHLLGNLQSKDNATHNKKWYKLHTMSLQLPQ